MEVLSLNAIQQVTQAAKSAKERQVLSNLRKLPVRSSSSKILRPVFSAIEKQAEQGRNSCSINAKTGEDAVYIRETLHELGYRTDQQLVDTPLRITVRW